MKFKIFCALFFVSAFAYGDVLHDAVRKNDFFEVSELLQDSTIDINSFDKNGFAPLHLAAQFDYVDIARALIEHGANVNSMYQDYSSYSRTPLQLAAEYNAFGVAELLVDTGADIHKHTGYWLTSPFDYAVKSNAVEVVRLLLPFQTYIHGENLLRSVNNNSYEVVKMLLDAGVDVNYMSDSFRFLLIFKMSKLGMRKTALHYAAEHNYANIALLLIQAGAKKNVKGYLGQTPQDLAKTPEMQRIFKHFGAVKKKQNK